MGACLAGLGAGAKGAQAARGGGWIGAWASHAVDQLRFVFDAEIEVVASEPTTRVTERPDADGNMRTCTAEDSLDPSCYDLLASEARLASFMAIAKGDVAARRWFRLGRS